MVFATSVKEFMRRSGDAADAPSRLYVFTALTQALTNVVRFAEVLIVWENQ